jgi:hypothetical protein
MAASPDSGGFQQMSKIRKIAVEKLFAKYLRIRAACRVTA